MKRTVLDLVRGHIAQCDVCCRWTIRPDSLAKALNLDSGPVKAALNTLARDGILRKHPPRTFFPHWGHTCFTVRRLQSENG